jgi:hypothetical protein
VGQFANVEEEESKAPELKDCLALYSYLPWCWTNSEINALTCDSGLSWNPPPSNWSCSSVRKGTTDKVIKRLGWIGKINYMASGRWRKKKSS